jgi:diacylglycerol kinase family enzyme
MIHAGIIDREPVGGMSRSAYLSGPRSPRDDPKIASSAPFLLVNPRAGNSATDALVAAARQRAVKVHLLARSDDPVELARSVDADALAIAGGDGSLAGIAAVAIERDLPFACVPFGTRNHFARDVGLDRDDPIAALDVLVEGEERRVDVGRANDRLFLNNVSLGLYAQLVHRRERHRRRRDALARARALVIVARSRRRLGITLDGSPVESRIVLVSNNAYDLDVLSIGERKRLDEGRLHVYISRGVLRSAWEERAGERFTIDSAAGSLQAAVDGEPRVLETPIDFRVELRALRVLVPPRSAAVPGRDVAAECDD